MLLETVARFLPEAGRFLVLADEPHPGVHYPSGCRVVPARALGIPDFEGFAFRYDPAEFAAALKPFAFQHLFDTQSCTHCIYLDPDIELWSSLPAVTEALAADAPFVLTPHILLPADEGDDEGTRPDDVAFLREGAFNLGFLGASLTPDARDILAWWARWLRRDCVNERPIGFYMDQRFMDLVPGFASGTRILHDPGLNVAHWNLSQRTFTPDAPGGPRVDGRPLGFFHYSGFDPARPDRLSADTTRWSGNALPPAWRAFLASYAARLAAAGHGTVPPGCYAYGRFASGVPIPDVVRRMFRTDQEAWAGDPFDTYEAWCHLPARDAVPGLGSAVPSLMLQWLQARHPPLANLSMREPGGAAGLTRWWIEHGDTVGVDRRFTQPLALAAGRQPLSPRAVRPAPQAGRADATVVAPLVSANAAGQAGRALSASLLLASGQVEKLDIQAAGTQPASGRALLLCVAPGQLRPFLHVLTPRLPDRAYRVFIPSGELVDLSPPVLEALAAVDEIWAPTCCVQAQLATATALPVLHMPLGWRWPRPAVPAAVSPDRPYILVEPDSFPGCEEVLAAVRAFEAAFRGVPGAYRPRLVVPRQKTGEWDGTLRNALAAADAVVLPDTASTPANRTALAAGAACVLALHRGEALGLPVMRALACGVPVVATDHGGCTDLLTPRTGFPVDAHPGEGPAPVRADPCHAAWSLREVFHRPDEARRRAAEGLRVQAASCDPAATATAIAARLWSLGLLPARSRMEAAA